ncbi:putative ubiquitin-specific protease UBP12 KNAG_0C02180 [Huiozyma naganishii CBS 8797]|uniref:ubiquitinyl hydrolase 1 n=1 Tax=Huiozyma naganishii (strain ATCC MYA-139 / BCRC 22969 / CBS 8797 / KCTC 17520 / NBRC 10181 / NCYC 3082 / Yp74L-3) TaxID=1071383 RepID=J7S4J6_HUIN7|nr:hypothetical protein KNAG_0C02180 [Kazachstania naganishii CBS 8797]CCK69329.1 hypothetical protein KNAG_0C02180 [Kazachstania naganishii CBS 8797]
MEKSDEEGLNFNNQIHNTTTNEKDISERVASPPSPSAEDSSHEDTNSSKQVEDIRTDIGRQRETIAFLLENSKRNEKEGNKVYIIPKFWYDNFFNNDIDEPSMLGPIDTQLIVKDHENFILNSYDSCPYISIPEEIFNSFVEWYGLSEGSQPVSTVLVTDSTNGTLITEYNKPCFKLQYLINPDQKSRVFDNHHPGPLYTCVSASKLSSIGDALEQALGNFFKIETHLTVDNSKVNVWLVKNLSEEEITLSEPYLINPMQFLFYPEKIKVTDDILSKSLRELDILNGIFIIETKRRSRKTKQHWASNYFHYNKLNRSTGTIGLSNLGNTCYMNSGLQCLVHIPQIRDYFVYNGFEKEINVNNPLGFQGHMARSFHGLIQSLFGDSIAPFPSYVSPTHFKSTLVHFNSMFSGFQQQDSQEFLAFLLDSLHEDLNRIVEKPYVEKPSLKPGDDINDFDTIKKLANETWKSHLMRNDSIITDIFVGMYKSTLECPECSNVSITFDPYNDLTLPLPINSSWNAQVRIFPSKLPPCMIEVELPKASTYQDLKEYVAKCLGMNAQNLYGCEVFNHQFYNNFESPDSTAQYLPIYELISESDIVVFYELVSEPGDLIIPVLNAISNKESNNDSLFGVPFFITIKAADVNNITLLRHKLEKEYINLSGGYVSPKSTENNEIKDIAAFPLLQEKYPDVDFKEYTDILQYATQYDDSTNLPEKPLFEIRIIETERSTSYMKENVSGEPIELWTPRAHLNLALAQDITDKVDAVVNDIFNYSNMLITKQQEKGTVPNNSLEPMDIDSCSVLENCSDKSESFTNLGSITEEACNEFLNEKTESGALSDTTVITPQSLLVCYWSKEVADEVFSHDNVVNWENPGKISNKELESIKLAESAHVEQETTLKDCLNLFSKKEVLGMSDSWYCPNCKEHRQATKKIELWNTPDVFLIHLKRFENTRSFSDKIDATILFPIEDLDMSEYLVYKDDPRGSVYDLIAVDNHYGGMGGGHYTAYVKNLTDQNWYYFDDSRVSKTSPEKSIAGSAYLLFYLRRGSLNNIDSKRLKDIIDTSRSEHEIQIQTLYTKQEELYEVNESSGASEDEQEDEENSDTAKEDDGNSDSGSDDNPVSSTGTESMDGFSQDEVSVPVENEENIAKTNTEDRSDTNYYTESLDVGQTDPGNASVNSSDNVEKRKKRLLNKVYSDKLLNSSSESLERSENGDTESVASIRSGGERVPVLDSLYA